MASRHLVKEIGGRKRYFDESICPICGATFLKRAEASTVYCSRKCVGVANRKTEPKLHRHVCAGCGVEFSTKKTHSKYCSKECCNKSRTKNRETVCEYCGKLFMRPRAAQRRYCSSKCAGAAQKTGAIYQCETCGADTYRTPSHRESHVFCGVDCRNEWMRTHDGKLKNGGIAHQSGYIFVRQEKKKYRGEHRLVMEAHIGRRLRSDEIVHHIDHDKTNNDISNLMVVTRAEHIRLHKDDTHAWQHKGN